MRPAFLALLLVALLLPAAPPAVSAQDDAVQLSMALTSAPANLDMPETYQLQIRAASTNAGPVAVGPVEAALQPGARFLGSTPAAVCQPGCVGTSPATIA